MKVAKRPSLCIKTHCPNHRPVQRIGPCELYELPRAEPFATEIFPWLYLGNARDAVNYETLRQKGVKYILNVSKEVETPEAEEKGFHYLKLDLEDNADTPIAKYFELTFAFIEEARAQSQKVLVHCRRGISRSATIVIAYVMRHCEMTFDEAFDYVKQRRDIINPNLGFVLALESISPKDRLLDSPVEEDVYMEVALDLVLAH